MILLFSGLTLVVVIVIVALVVFDGTGDIFRIQTRIAESIARELKAIITPEEKQLIEKTATTSLTAYDFYQRGREEYSKYSSDNREALEFNPNDWMAYYYKGHIYMWVLEDFVKSIENLHEAVIRNRGEELPGLLSSLARAFLDIGFVDKAKYYYEEVFKLETDSFRYFQARAWIEFSIGNFEKAIEFLEKTHEIDSTDLWSDPLNTFAGKHQEAYENYIKIIKRRKESGELSLVSSHRIGYAFWKVGKYEEAEYYFDQQIKYGTEMIKLGRQLSTRMAAHYDLAGVYAFRGEKEKAYQYLDEFNKKKTYPLWWVNMIKHDPLFNSMRDEDQFQKILQNGEGNSTTRFQRKIREQSRAREQNKTRELHQTGAKVSPNGSKKMPLNC
jgi:tetratricopeptide (TPR) repeat protein